jgi:phospholipase C
MKTPSHPPVIAGFMKAVLFLAFSTILIAAPEDEQKRPGDQKQKFTDIEHVVVVMMENRSFDHFLGWLPGANGRQAGLTYFDAAGVGHSTFPLAPEYQGCDHPDPDHSHAGGLIEYDSGKCDGWLRAGNNDLFSIGYYVQADLPFLGQAAPAWTTCDRYFSATLAETFPNRIYQHSAQTDRLDNTLNLSELPTIWDRLAERNVEGRYYFSDVPFLALWGTKYLPISRLIGQFFTDCAAGTLPAVCFVDPSFRGEDVGLSNDDHPHADIRNGEVFLNAIYEAVTSSPNWANTVLIINFDEWGGFFDHVPPPPAPIPPADLAAGNRDGLRGFRVPALVISPWARRGAIASGLYDHTSVLKMIEARWRLRPLTVRDASANNLAEVLDFRRPVLTAPRFAVPPGPFGFLCPGPTVARLLDNSLQDPWVNLGNLARQYGFPAPPGK